MTQLRLVNFAALLPRREVEKIIHEIKTPQKIESATSHGGWHTGCTNLIWALRGWY